MPPRNKNTHKSRGKRGKVIAKCSQTSTTELVKVEQKYEPDFCTAMCANTIDNVASFCKNNVCHLPIAAAGLLTFYKIRELEARCNKLKKRRRCISSNKSKKSCKKKPVGAQGNQGINGAQGAQGAQGLAGTGNQGAQGTQGNTGSSGFGVQGVRGPQGNQGGLGPQGIAGTAANQGLQGPQGFQSSIGFQGSQGTGSQGSVGSQGAVGAQGFQSSVGFQGSQGTGVQGGQGNDGVQGNQGAQGSQGNIGFQGIPGIATNQGLQGPQGTQGFQGSGVQGSQGDQGVQGNQGNQGSLGFQGAQGAQSFQDFQGFIGFQGTQGFQGIQGPQGSQGSQGILGIQGFQGPEAPGAIIPFSGAVAGTAIAAAPTVYGTFGFGSDVVSLTPSPPSTIGFQGPQIFFRAPRDGTLRNLRVLYTIFTAVAPGATADVNFTMYVAPNPTPADDPTGPVVASAFSPTLIQATVTITGPIVLGSTFAVSDLLDTHPILSGESVMLIMDVTASVLSVVASGNLSAGIEFV